MEQWLNRYWAAVLSFVIFLAITIGGYLGYRYYAQGQQEKQREIIFEWKKSIVSLINEHGAGVDVFKSEWQRLGTFLSSDDQLSPVVIELLPLLREKHWEALIIELFDPLLHKLSPESTSYFFLLRDLLPVYEDQRQWKKAISLIEPLLKKDSLWMDVKWQFDLGRLYRLDKQEQKAKEKFQYVVDQYPDHALAKLARLYLEQ